MIYFYLLRSNITADDFQTKIEIFGDKIFFSHMITDYTTTLR